ncbi:hypothetical protein AB0M39_38365 [Streptomyces sp. NPDC051907]|uniref:hypothetical protein n=1 Tax=Streptomyces sp. NPDC051907 TaxID=3155284 RepID=UPI0034172E9D
MRTRMRRGVAAALTASALCLTAVACGGDDEKKSSSSAKGDDKGKGEAAEKPALKALTAAQLQASTLEVKDLPKGWKAEKATDDTEPAPKASKPECQPIAGMMSGKIDGATMGKSADFVTEGTATALSTHAFTFDGNGAADYTKAVGDALDKCTTVTFTSDGEKTDIAIAKLPAAPKVAEESHAFRMTMKIAELDVEVKVDLLVARQGSGISRSAFIPGEDPKGDTIFADIAKRAGDKLVKGASS